jgi:hypothetical protein
MSSYTPERSISTSDIDYEQLCKEFVGEVRSMLATLTGEIAYRNNMIMQNDAYIYDDLMSRQLDIPIGHDFTPVNWLRRTVEIHRAQMMGDGFSVVSSYISKDVEQSDDPDQQKQLQLDNKKKKDYAEARKQLIEAINRDNMADSLWARMSENASAIGNSVLKTWFDERTGKFMLSMVEAVEHCYAIWSKDDFRSYDLFAYVYQVSKQQAVSQFGVSPDVATSPLGMPLAVLSSANTIEYISTQPMVTVMEIRGRAQGWGTNSEGTIQRVSIGSENDISSVIVGDKVNQVIDDPKYLPNYYIFPNKLVRRRPWGLSDISPAAVNINQTYIETLSDWRTVAQKVNFPKFKAFGFGFDTQLPKPKARTVEMIGLAEGQDIQPIQNPSMESNEMIDFERQMSELKEEFVREVGISQILFDNPEAQNQGSNQVNMTSMMSISDLVESKRQLWSPIIAKVYEDAMYTLALWDDNIKELVEGDDGWYLRVLWPPALRKDDPAYQTMLLNRLNTNTISLQTFLEKQGETKEELDRIKDELTDKTYASIHGKIISSLAELMIMPPPQQAPPKVSVNLRGDISPNQEANLAAMHGFNNGPIYGPTEGPQGQSGIRSIDNFVNQGMISGPAGAGGGSQGGQAIQYDQNGQPLPGYNPNVPEVQPQQQSMMTPPENNQPGMQPMSQPGSGQPTATTPQGRLNKEAQRRGK